MKLRNPCKNCDYFHPENNTCQSKKVATTGIGKINIIDRLFCKTYKAKAYPTQIKGKFYWKIIGDGRYAQCSNCGMSFQDVYDFDNYDAYCRHCGVKMEGIE